MLHSTLWRSPTLRLAAVTTSLWMTACKPPPAGQGAGTQTTGTQTTAGEPSGGTLATEDDKAFYAVGAMLGRNAAELDLKPEELKVVLRGFEDQALGRKLELDPQASFAKVNDLRNARRARRSEGEKLRAKEYLDKAAKEKGATVLPSGLIFFDEKPGSGAQPSAADRVKVHYRGTLTDGTEFDSSYKRGQPIEFPLSGVIPCWTEGVQKIKVGGKARLVCPSAIAYGDRGSPPAIPGGAALIFEVELIDVVSGAAAPAPAPAPAAPAPKGK